MILINNSLESFFQKINEAYGFDYYAMTIKDNQDHFLVSNYPDQWLEHYDSHNLYKDDYAHSPFPHIWGETISCRLPKIQQMIFSDAQDFGINSGYTIPTLKQDDKKVYYTVGSKHKDIQLTPKIKKYQSQISSIFYLLTNSLLYKFSYNSFKNISEDELQEFYSILGQNILCNKSDAVKKSIIMRQISLLKHSTEFHVPLTVRHEISNIIDYIEDLFDDKL